MDKTLLRNSSIVVWKTKRKIRERRNREVRIRWDVALYSKKKDKLRIWIACKRWKAEIIEWVVWDRWATTWKKFKNRLKDLKVKYFATDYWQIYEKIIEKEKHIQTKAETFTIEWLNNLIRHYFARFHRKTHCYSKSKYMVNLTLALFAVRKTILTIFN